MKTALTFSILCLLALSGCDKKTPADEQQPVSLVAEISILTQVLSKFEDCQSAQGIQVNEPIFSFTCTGSQDSTYGIAISRFNTEAEAQAQFDYDRGDLPPVFMATPYFKSRGKTQITSTFSKSSWAGKLTAGIFMFKHASTMAMRIIRHGNLPRPFTRLAWNAIFSHLVTASNTQIGGMVRGMIVFGFLPLPEPNSPIGA